MKLRVLTVHSMATQFHPESWQNPTSRHNHISAVLWVNIVDRERFDFTFDGNKDLFLEISEEELAYILLMV